MRCEFCPRPPRAEEIDDDDDDFGESRGAKGDRKASTEERDEIVFDIIFRNAIEKKRDVLVVFFICVEFLYLSQEKRVVFFPDKTKTLNVCLRMEPDFEIGIPKASKSSSKSSSSQKEKKERREKRRVVTVFFYCACDKRAVVFLSSRERLIKRSRVREI